MIRGEWLSLGVAISLFAWGLIQGGGTGTRLGVVLPVGLLFLATVNGFLRSKILGWGIFTCSFVFFLMILGALTMSYRAMPGFDSGSFGRSLGLYVALGLSGLFQLRWPVSHNSRDAVSKDIEHTLRRTQ